MRDRRHGRCGRARPSRALVRNFPWLRSPRSWAGLTLFSACLKGLAETVDVSQLPPPVAKRVDFLQDIKPILQQDCYKCHSGEKPRSHLRLTSHDAALKGGEHGVDIIPGNSAASPLIHYVARLVPDMEMPPEGRGTPLSPEQVGLFRAWIDQGVTWEGAANEPATVATASPTVGWTSVSGDMKKFRELYWQREGWNGGLEEFSIIEKPTPDSSITAAGHVLLDDYRITLDLQKNDLGFARFGWSQFRKYYDDTGGYYPLFTPSSFSLNQDLHFDDGRAWVDFGLTLPRWPAITIGYEHQYRDGTEATLQWGPVTQTQAGKTRNIYPAFKDLSEKTEILKFDLDYETAGVVMSDSFRGEWYKLDTQQVNESGLTSAGTAFTLFEEHQSHFEGANTVHLEKQFTDWLFGAGGYLYSKLTADGSVNTAIVNPASIDFSAPPPYGWQADPVQLERESHVFSLSALLGPWEGFNFSLATQNEWTHQTGLAAGNVQLPPFPAVLPPAPESLFSDWDHSVFSQDVGLRFTKIPFTTLFAEARFQQDDVGQFETDSTDSNALTPFVRNTDASSDLKDFRAGFNTSPWRRVSLSALYRRYDNNTYYNNWFKESPLQFVAAGYPAFISERTLLSNEADAKLALQLTPWLKTSLTYQWLANDYHTTTDPVSDPVTGDPTGISPGGSLQAGSYDAQTTSLNAVLTPWRRLFLSTTFAYQHARTVTAANDDPSVAPYTGDIYSVMLSGNYALNPKTDLIVSYAFSTANFSQDNLAQGLPLGIHYSQHGLQAAIKRQIAKGKTLGLQYRFYSYDEPSTGGINNFQAHAVFATLTWRFQ